MEPYIHSSNPLCSITRLASRENHSFSAVSCCLCKLQQTSYLRSVSKAESHGCSQKQEILFTHFNSLTPQTSDSNSISGITLNAITLTTVADEDSDSDDGGEDRRENENGVHANGNGEENGESSGLLGSDRVHDQAVEQELT